MTTYRPHRLIAFAVLAVAFLFPTAEAKKADAPGIQKKLPLTISPVVINVTSYSVTISWTTNKKSDSAISVTEIPAQFPSDGVIHRDASPLTEHQMSVEPLIPGRTYEYEVISTDLYGFTVRSVGTFSTPL